MSPPLSATLSTSVSYITHTFVVPKTAGLGVIVGGGQGKLDGPHIIIDKILGGMDAANVSPFLVHTLDWERGEGAKGTKGNYYRTHHAKQFNFTLFIVGVHMCGLSSLAMKLFIAL